MFISEDALVPQSGMRNVGLGKWTFLATLKQRQGATRRSLLRCGLLHGSVTKNLESGGPLRNADVH
jgi:hypothetical protein